MKVGKISTTPATNWQILSSIQSDDLYFERIYSTHSMTEILVKSDHWPWNRISDVGF
jgi:hypothetical protein